MSFQPIPNTATTCFIPPNGFLIAGFEGFFGGSVREFAKPFEYTISSGNC